MLTCSGRRQRPSTTWLTGRCPRLEVAATDSESEAPGPPSLPAEAFLLVEPASELECQGLSLRCFNLYRPAQPSPYSVRLAPGTQLRTVPPDTPGANHDRDLCEIYVRAAGTLYGPDRLGFYNTIRDVPRTGLGWATSATSSHWPFGTRTADRRRRYTWMDIEAPRPWSQQPES